MQNLGFALDASWQVLLWSLALGAGLPALFALGIRSLAWGTAHDDDGSTERHPAGRAIAFALFGLVILCLLGGILVIVLSGLGMKLDFTAGFPFFTK